jgi:hypothetical protein
MRWGAEHRTRGGIDVAQKLGQALPVGGRSRGEQLAREDDWNSCPGRELQREGVPCAGIGKGEGTRTCAHKRASERVRHARPRKCHARHPLPPYLSSLSTSPDATLSPHGLRHTRALSFPGTPPLSARARPRSRDEETGQARHVHTIQGAPHTSTAGPQHAPSDGPGSPRPISRRSGCAP